MRDHENGTDGRYPFLREWPALTLKLMLLYAARLGADATGWTRGAHQAHRYRGSGAERLKELYDRMLYGAYRAWCCSPLGLNGDSLDFVQEFRSKQYIVSMKL